MLARKHKPQFLYHRLSCLNITGALVGLWCKVPLVVEFNGPEAWANTYWGPKRFWRLTRLIRWCEKFSFYRAHTIVVVSYPLKEYVQAQGIDGKKILVNPNGVDTLLFNPVTLVHESADIRKMYAIEEKFIFGFIGTFGVWHGTHVFAELIPAICEQFPHAHFLLIGSGPELTSLKKKLENYLYAVTFTGSVEYSQARNYLAACDAFVCPTQPNSDGTPFFGSPTKLFEYLSMGKPIIASNLEQIKDIVQPAVMIHKEEAVSGKEVGFLVTPTDMQGFNKAAQTVLAMSPAQRTQMGNNARNLAQNNYSWCAHTYNIECFFNR